MANNISRILGGLCVAGALFASACGPTAPYRPYSAEGGSGASIDEFTYVSSAHAPKTITVVDTRTDEVVFAVDIPVGQQLVVNFDDKKADREKYMSGTMRWGVMKAGTRFGNKRNQVEVPPARSRRIDMVIRDGPEVSTPPMVETMTPPPLTDASE